MSLHSEGLVIPLKDQEATGGGVSVAQKVSMYRIWYKIQSEIYRRNHTLMTHMTLKYVKLGDIDGDTDALLILLIGIYYGNTYSDYYIYK